MKIKYILSITTLIAFIFSGCLMEEPDDPLVLSGSGSSSGAGFYANNTNVEPGETVYFTNTSHSRYEYFYWEFGDGNFSYDEDPYHAYYDEGYYDVSLYVWNADGEDDQEIKYGYINVGYGTSDFVAYAWNLSSGNINMGPVKITNGSLSGISYDNSDFMSGGDWAEGNWYASQYGTNYLYQISTSSGSKSYVGAMSLNSVTGLAYDVTSNTMYASDYSDGNSYLYTVNLNNASVNYVGFITDGLIIGIACNENGILYGIMTSDDNLYYINKSSGSGSPIGNLGININYAQDIAFDRNTGILWGSLYVDADAKNSDKDSRKPANQTKGVYTGIYQINLNTGYATEIYDIEYEMGALAIPHNY